MSLKTTLRNAPRQAARALLRTPLEVLLGAAAWIVIALAIEDLATDNTATRLAITTAIALPLVYGTSFLAASGTITRWIRWLIATTAIAVAGLYGFLLFDPDLTAERWRAATLIAASILALLAAPLASWQPNGPGRRALVYRFATRLTVRVAIVGLYAAALYAGLAAALAAVNGLFSLELPSRLYTHLAALVFALLPPWAIAAGLPALVAPPAPWGEITLRALRRTALLLLPPLSALLLLTVYASIRRLLVTGEAPSNLISPVGLGAGALTLAATLLVEPLHGRDDAITLTRFVRTLPPPLPPLTGLALWAVLIRVGQYGWTEFRYLRVLAILLLGAFAIAGSWRLILRRLPPLTALPAIAAATLAIATIGPLSAPAVSLRSQETRLTTLLAEARGQHQPRQIPTRSLRRRRAPPLPRQRLQTPHRPLRPRPRRRPRDHRSGGRRTAPHHPRGATGGRRDPGGHRRDGLPRRLPAAYPRHRRHPAHPPPTGRPTTDRGDRAPRQPDRARHTRPGQRTTLYLRCPQPPPGYHHAHHPRRAPSHRSRPHPHRPRRPPQRTDRPATPHHQSNRGLRHCHRMERTPDSVRIAARRRGCG